MVNINISNSSTLPLYEQIVSQLKAHILAGRLEQGELLPSIRLLAKELEVSIITTKRAYDELEAEGFVTTVAGKGTFVAIENKERLKDMRMREVEQYLQQAVEAAKSIDVGPQELGRIIQLLFEEETI